MAGKRKEDQDFTKADRSRYSAIANKAVEEDIRTTTKTTATPYTDTEKRPYHRLDPREAPPKEYRFTARMPGEYGRFLNELAYQRRSTITAELQRLVKEEMDKRPEILASLDVLNE